MSKSTTLASSRITSADDIVTITYVEPLDAPPAVFLSLPSPPPTGCQQSPTPSWPCWRKPSPNWGSFGPANGSSQGLARLAGSPVPVRANPRKKGPGLRRGRPPSLTQDAGDGGPEKLRQT